MFCTLSAHFSAIGTPPRNKRFQMQCGECEMNNQNGGMGVALGAFALLAAVVFIATGGSLGGKKTVEGDRDLPPVASPSTVGQGGGSSAPPTR
jgi:hypothetical protein